jgi:cobalamin biosynthesis Mg chelatase CobN
VAFGVLLSASPSYVLGHGGEDHGDQKPKSTANAKGIVSHSARLGEMELMLKHPALEPDQTTSGRLFITKFDTNEPFREAVAKVEMESSSGEIFTATTEVGEQPGTYALKFPALPRGTYNIRANVSHGGETDTATFSGIEVRPAVVSAEAGASWITTLLIGVVFSLVVVLLIGLVYFVWRFAPGPMVNEEALSA